MAGEGVHRAPDALGPVVRLLDHWYGGVEAEISAAREPGEE